MLASHSPNLPLGPSSERPIHSSKPPVTIITATNATTIHLPRFNFPQNAPNHPTQYAPKNDEHFGELAETGFTQGAFQMQQCRSSPIAAVPRRMCGDDFGSAGPDTSDGVSLLPFTP
jgi:hypothetical protein